MDSELDANIDGGICALVEVYEMFACKKRIENNQNEIYIYKKSNLRSISKIVAGKDVTHLDVYDKITAYEKDRSKPKQSSKNGKKLKTTKTNLNKTNKELLPGPSRAHEVCSSED